MSHRERMLRAIRHREPDRVPVDAICIENTDAVARLLRVPSDAVLDRLGIDGRCVAAWSYSGDLPVRDGRKLSPWGTEEGGDYGDAITFFGAVSTQSPPFQRPDQVADEVRRCTDALAEGGGYICGPDHHIKPDVPPENVVARFGAARAVRQPNATGLPLSADS